MKSAASSCLARSLSVVPSTIHSPFVPASRGMYFCAVVLGVSLHRLWCCASAFSSKCMSSFSSFRRVFMFKFPSKLVLWACSSVRTTKSCSTWLVLRELWLSLDRAPAS